MVDVRYSIDDYDYELPPERIAQEPLGQRGASRLLVMDRRSGRTQHRSFGDLPDLLAPGDLLVVNRSRVIAARLLGRRPRGGAAEVLLVRRRGRDLWEAMVRPGRRLSPGAIVEIAPGFRVRIEASRVVRTSDPPRDGPLRLVRLLTDSLDPDAAVDRHGHVPLPPYIRREDRASDRERYQTVYASEPGSIAAPTAGLHFTTDLLARLDRRGVERVELVLHVGPATFRPVDVVDIRTHRVDPERYFLPANTAAALRRARAEDRRIVSVGTTTTRALESALTPHGALEGGEGETGLVIIPGFSFRIVGALLTNFHLPRSSLLLLVAAFGGRERVLAAYAEAIREGYRFYSYGDAMLVV